MGAENEFERINRMRVGNRATPQGQVRQQRAPGPVVDDSGRTTPGNGNDAPPRQDGPPIPPGDPGGPEYEYQPPAGPLQIGDPRIEPYGGPRLGVGGGGWDRNSAKALQQDQSKAPTQGAIPFNQSPGLQIAGQRISGQSIVDDPAIAAALANFRQNVQPGIENQATLAGLGRSTALTNALATSQAQMLAPMYESAFGREGDRINRLGGAAENELGRRERSSVRSAEANQNSINQLMSLSEMLYGRRQGTQQAAMAAGQTERGIRQAGLDAQNQDYLRRQALSEQGLFTPFGQMMPSAIGSRTMTTGK